MQKQSFKNLVSVGTKLKREHRFKHFRAGQRVQFAFFFFQGMDQSWRIHIQVLFQSPISPLNLVPLQNSVGVMGTSCKDLRSYTTNSIFLCDFRICIANNTFLRQVKPRHILKKHLHQQSESGFTSLSFKSRTEQKTSVHVLTCRPVIVKFDELDNFWVISHYH